MNGSIQVEDKFNLLSESNLIYIYGSGTFAHRIEKSLLELGFDSIQFLEFENKFMNRATNCISPESMASGKYNKIAILGLGNAYAEICSIATRLEALGFVCIYPVEISQYLYSHGIHLDNYWLTGDKTFFQQHNDEVDNLISLFSDDISKKNILNIIDYRCRGNPFALNVHDSPLDLYFPKNIKWITSKVKLNEVIDAGAHFGESINVFVKNGIEILSWNFFEPNSQNFNQLKRNIKSKTYCFKVRPIKKALWDTTCELRMNNSGNDNSGAYVAKDGDEVIEATSIDDFLSGKKCSLIKLDIEGSEIYALRGAINTIQKSRPFMAISVYHKPADLWEIPLYIASLGLEYEFYIRTHCEQTFETVLYCSPKKRN